MNSENYYDSVASHYDSLYNDCLSLAENQFISDLLASDINNPRSNFSVLDLGCGTGLGLELLINLGFADINYHGSDISNKMIQEAKNKFASFPKAKFSVCDMSNLEAIPDESIDYVFSLFGSFSHSIKYGITTSEIYRVLKPSGKILIMAYSRNSIRNINNAITGVNRNLLRFIHSYDVRNNNSNTSCLACFYTPTELNLLFGGFGFENIKVIGLNFISEFKLIKRLIWKSQLFSNEWLKLEQLLFGKRASLGHSLILRARKLGCDILTNLNEPVKLRA